MTTKFEDYKDKYENIKLERDDNGVLLMTLHTKGGEMIWGMQPDDDLGHAFIDMATDPDNKVIIMTGTGDTFIHREDLGMDGDAVPPEVFGGWIIPYAIRLINNQLDIDVPMIAAVNGPVTIHADVPLLCDIVLASDTAAFADQPHFPNGLVPGDGVHVIWPALIGMNRARYLMYTGQVLTAQEAKELGLVAEVLPKDQLISRARQLAGKILETPELTRRMTRRTFSAVWRKQFEGVLPYGLALEGLAAAKHWPTSFKPAELP